MGYLISNDDQNLLISGAAMVAIPGSWPTSGLSISIWPFSAFANLVNPPNLPGIKSPKLEIWSREVKLLKERLFCPAIVILNYAIQKLSRRSWSSLYEEVYESNKVDLPTLVVNMLLLMTSAQK